MLSLLSLLALWGTLTTVQGAGPLCTKCKNARDDEYSCNNQLGMGDHTVQCGGREVCTTKVRCDKRGRLAFTKGCTKRGKISGLEEIFCNDGETSCSWHCDGTLCNENAPAELWEGLACYPGAPGPWFERPGCGESMYPDAGEDVPLLSRIVNGAQARLYEFPFMARMTWFGYQWCGGILITDQFVLTAAHCLDGLEVQTSLKFHLGEHDRKAPTPEKEKRTFNWVSHPGYNKTTFDNDIALVRLDEPISTESGTKQPACRPDQNDLYVGRKAIVMGWGKKNYTDADFDNPEILQWAPMEVITNADCEAQFNGLHNGNGPTITDGMMCAFDGGTGKERDSCAGDSGGPLVVKKVGGSFQAVGIVSWGQKCAAGLPGVYTRISHYLDWINFNMKHFPA